MVKLSNTAQKRLEELSTEEYELLQSYVERKISYESEVISPSKQELKENLYRYLLEDEQFLARAIKAEKKYQALTPEQKESYDERKKWQIKLNKEHSRHYSREQMRKGTVISKAR